MPEQQEENEESGKMTAKARTGTRAKPSKAKHQKDGSAGGKSAGDILTRVVPVAAAAGTAITVPTARGIRLDRPVLIAGFPDSGMIGSVSINHLIEHLEMHQIAFVESQYVMPAALFIGKKFRHPFRIYANNAGSVCTLICEVPTLARGTYSIVGSIVNWCLSSGVSEVIVIGGISPSNFSGASHLQERKALLLQSGAAEPLQAEESEEGRGERGGDDAAGDAVAVPTTALIAGLAGALLSACVARDLKCRGLMMPTVGEVPDPEGAAILLESLAKMVPGLKVDTAPLREEAEMIKKRLEELLRMHQQAMREYERAAAASSAATAAHPDTERIYK